MEFSSDVINNYFYLFYQNTQKVENKNENLAGLNKQAAKCK